MTAVFFASFPAGLSAGADTAEKAVVLKAEETITADELKGHASVLSSDAFEGREAGRRGGRAAGVYVVQQLRKLKALQPAGEEGTYFQPFGNNYRNILALLPGRHPRRKKEFLIVCGHYDHVGYGTERNSYGPIGYIHNGADDNASGTAAVLEIAEAFAALPEEHRPQRSILFIFWDAEEKGLLGSEYWVEHPTVPLKQVQLVINLDMIGRLRKEIVEIHGSRSGRGLRRLLSEANSPRKNGEGLRLDFKWSLPRKSDHNSFINVSVPAIMVTTREHEDYHRPSDDAHKLRADGMQRVARFAFRLAQRMAGDEPLPRFRPACRQEEDADRQRFLAPLPPLPPRLGVTWDGQQAAAGKIVLQQITPGSPAEKAGLQPGDHLLRFNGIRITGTNQLLAVVMVADNPVSAEVQRPGVKQPMTLTVHLNGHPRRVGIAWDLDDAEPHSVVLRRVIYASPAAVAGLQRGDRIYAVNGKPVLSNEEFRRQLWSAKKGLVLTRERQGRLKTVRLTWAGITGSRNEKVGTAAAPRRSVPAPRP